MEHKFELSVEELEKCESFSNNSAKSQREYRSGGSLLRLTKMISQDTLRGKVAELIVKKFLEQDFFGFKKIKLDFDIYPRGKWDKSDIDINGFSISIKSSKSFAKWLLVEKKDLERGDLYDFYIMVLVDKSFASGKVKGFVSKNKIAKIEGKTLLLKKGEFIPGTSTVLDADNHGILITDLKNSNQDWVNFKLNITSKELP